MMLWSPEIRRPLGGVERTFALRWGQLCELESESGVGALLLHRQMGLRVARRRDVEAIIRLGLLGGGMTDERALSELLDRYVRGRPGAASEVLAFEILNQALYEPAASAAPADDEGNPAPAGENAAPTTTADGPAADAEPSPTA